MARLEIDFASRIRASQLAEIAAATELRGRARQLQSAVKRGHYDDSEVQEYWRIIQESNITLRASNTQLSEKAGLGPRYFSTAPGRRPKLANMLRALDSVVEFANERLADVEEPGRDALDDSWFVNPLLKSNAAVAELQQKTDSLIVQLGRSNSLSVDPALDELWRNEMIARLETLLLLLKAPLLDHKFLDRTAKLLRKAAGKLGDYTLGAAVGFLMNDLAAQLLHISSQ